MTLIDALSQGPQKPLSRAFPESLRERLPDDEYEALTALLARSEWSAAAIAQLLREHHDISVSPRTIRDQRHRFLKAGV